MPLSNQKVFAAINSRKRGVCICLAFAVALLLIFFPPWVETIKAGERKGERIKLWHAPYSHSPAKPNMWVSYGVDYPRMLSEIAVGECFVLALYLTWARPRG
jgi:hypothetical protein